MCGIFGAVATPKSNLDQKDLRKLILAFFRLAGQKNSNELCL